MVPIQAGGCNHCSEAHPRVGAEAELLAPKGSCSQDPGYLEVCEDQACLPAPPECGHHATGGNLVNNCNGGPDEAWSQSACLPGAL